MIYKVLCQNEQGLEHTNPREVEGAMQQKWTNLVSYASACPTINFKSMRDPTGRYQLEANGRNCLA